MKRTSGSTKGDKTTPNGGESAVTPSMRDESLDPIDLYRVYRASGSTITENAITALKTGSALDMTETNRVMTLLGFALLEQMLLGDAPLREKLDMWFRHRNLAESKTSKLDVTQTVQMSSEAEWLERVERAKAAAVTAAALVKVKDGGEAVVLAAMLPPQGENN